MNSRQLTVLLVLSCIWGASFLFIKVIVDAGIGPAGLTAGRSILGFLTLLPLVYRYRAQFPRSGRTWAALAGLGILNFGLPWTLFAIAESDAPSGAASVVNALQPLWAALFAIPLLKSAWFGGWRLTGLLLGFAGVCLLMGQDLFNSDGAGARAIVIMAGATACYALSNVLIGRSLRDLAPLPLAAGQLGFAALFLVPIALFTGSFRDVSVSPAPILSMLALGGLGSGMALVAFMWLLKQVGPVRSAVVTYIMPPIGVWLGWLVLGEPVGWNLLVGLALIISGVALVQQARLGSLARRIPLFQRRAAAIEPVE